MAKFLGVILAILIAVGVLPASSPAHAQVGCTQEAVVITPPQSGTFDSRFNVTPVAPTGFMAVLFTGVDMPGEPQKAVLLRSGSAFTYSSGVFYAVCSGDLRGLTVRYGWDLYTRGYGLTVTEVWDMITSPVRLARWEVNTVPTPQPVPPIQYPYVPVVPQPAVPAFPTFPYQPAPSWSWTPPIQSCGPLNYTTVDPTSGRVYGAAVVRVTFDGYQLKVVKSVFGDQTLTVQGARLIEVLEAPGCGSQVVGTAASNWIAQGGSTSFDSTPTEFQNRFLTGRRP